MAKVLSPTVTEGLGSVRRITMSGEARQMVLTAMLANLRGELKDDTLIAQAKACDAVANMLSAEVKVVRAQVELREAGATIGKVAHLGQMLIGDEPRTAA